MAYYMVHTCNKRFWYVKNFLLPSMIEQGINPDNIFVYQDKNEIGNLRAWVDSCNRALVQCARKSINGIWHLQDDVVICKDFKGRTEQLDSGLVCGFTCCYDDTPQVGTFRVVEQKIWYSFPCIRIPTFILIEFTKWANENLWQSKYFKSAVKRNNCDDLIFKEWLFDNYPSIEETNVSPNLVNHIDKWIGGSVCNQQRDLDQDTMSAFWVDNGELADIKAKLDKRNLV